MRSHRVTLCLAMTRLILLCVILAVSTQSAHDANVIRRAVEERYRHAATLKASFFESYDDGSGGVSAESGTVYFSHTGRMRWEYESPEQKVFLVDGTNVWFYVPADHVVSRAKLKESEDWRTPLLLLAGRADLSRLCRSIRSVNPAQVANSKPEDSVLRCVPRGGPDAGQDASSVLLETDRGANLVRIVIQEPGNVETEFRFGNWEENIAIPEKMFHFAPPPGVTIVNEEALAGENR